MYKYDSKEIKSQKIYEHKKHPRKKRIFETIK